jgi:S-disulfanyl-L-cysteine oxidoreductase SoxD
MPPLSASHAGVTAAGRARARKAVVANKELQRDQRIITLEYDEVMRPFALLAVGLAALTILPALLRSTPQAPAVTSVWDGVYAADQAKRGKEVYANACASCHGDELEGEGQAPALAGKDFLMEWDKRSVGDLYEATKGPMPADKPGSLSAAQTVDVLSYIFQMNHFPTGKTDMPAELEPLKKIKFEAKK